MKSAKQPFACHQQGHQQCVAEALAHAETICKERKLRLTPLRRRVLELVWQSHKPVGAYELLEILQRQGKAAPPTVYRTLDFLQQQGLVHRLASRNAFIGCSRPGEPHAGQFLICSCCSSLAELVDQEVSGVIEQSAVAAGFQVQQQTVEISGLCPRCQQESDR